MALRERRETVLRAIIEDYITRVAPVSSNTIVEKYGLRVSPATIRNDTAYLEREGYVIHPHHSAGSVPTDKAYRYYVELIGEEIELPHVEQYLIHQISQEAKEELEQWLKTLAALLA
ncbi:MAG: DeoR family transcriptional regulator, partial [Dehalococcoidia bacterium]|nr:DeoR family transcriptional regulator [Dehalococcoidia bacterium]